MKLHIFPIDVNPNVFNVDSPLVQESQFCTKNVVMYSLFKEKTHLPNFLIISARSNVKDCCH